MSSSFAWIRNSSIVGRRSWVAVVILAGAWAGAGGAASGADATPEKPAKEQAPVAQPPNKKPADEKPADNKVDAKKDDAKKIDPKQPDAKQVDPTKPTVTKSPATNSTEKKPPTKKPATTKPAVTKPATKPTVKKQEQPWTPGGKYRAHDMQRPRPPVVTPPTASTAAQAGAPPSDAIVLFDGKSLEAWLLEGRDPKTKQLLTTPAAWPVRDGYLEVPPRSAGSRGTIVTREEFGSCQLHIEFATPAAVSGAGQGRGNSGILLHGVCEVQVLDSFENDTYPDGQAAAIYSSYPPLVNASRKPGEWQTYDIILELARPVSVEKLAAPADRPTDGAKKLAPPKPEGAKETTKEAVKDEAAKEAVKQKSTKPASTEEAIAKETPMKPLSTAVAPTKPKLRPARITVLHNGVIVQHAEELASTATKFKLALQDHNNPVRYRNIWIRPLKERE